MSVGYNESQSVPRDGGYCNGCKSMRHAIIRCVSIRPEGRGVLQPCHRAPPHGGRNVSIRPEGRGVLQRREWWRPRRGSSVSIRPEGRGVLQPSSPPSCSCVTASQSVPRDGGYCNESFKQMLRESIPSQSVPRDGGYCNLTGAVLTGADLTSQSVPRDGGYCNSWTR